MPLTQMLKLLFLIKNQTAIEGLLEIRKIELWHRHGGVIKLITK